MTNSVYYLEKKLSLFKRTAIYAQSSRVIAQSLRCVDALSNNRSVSRQEKKGHAVYFRIGELRVLSDVGYRTVTQDGELSPEA